METQYSIKKSVSLTGSNAITQAELKNYIKQTNDVTAENNLVEDMITAVTFEAQELTNLLLNTAATITCQISVDEPNSNGQYIFKLPFDNVTISTLTSITLLDSEGDSVAVDSNDYRLQGNELIMKLSYMQGYYITLEYDITITAGELTQYKTALMEYGGYKYMNRSESSQIKAMEIFGRFISYQDWM